MRQRAETLRRGSHELRYCARTVITACAPKADHSICWEMAACQALNIRWKDREAGLTSVHTNGKVAVMSNLNVPRLISSPVLVTGATGYVAGWLIKRLLDVGTTVHAAVRDPANSAKIAHLQAMAETSPGAISFFRADLLEAGSHDAAMRGCGIVFHTASPFLWAGKVNNPQRDLVEPALLGTRDILASANRTPTMTRVVLTSSCAAISGGAADILAAPNGMLTEDQWNTVSTVETNGYSYSKTVAERAAWAMADQQTQWKLVVINPALVLGPATSNSPTSASFDYVKALGDGTFKDDAPAFEIGMVDVRDVAEAHFRAAAVDAAQGRHIVFNTVHGLSDLVEMLRPRFGDAWLFPRRTDLPQDRTRWRADNGKSIRTLGMHYRPVEDAVIAMFEQIVECGIIAKG